MRQLIMGMLIISGLAFAKNSKTSIVSINTPVKEQYLKIEFNSSIDFKSVKAKLHSTKKGKQSKILWEYKDEVLQKENSNYIVYINISSLLPGDYITQVKLVKSNDEETVLKSTSGSPKISFNIDESLEVPDPGDEGLKTLKGLSIDDNPVRDDIQRFSNIEVDKLPISSENKTILKNYNLKNQEIFDYNLQDENSFVSYSDNRKKLISCITEGVTSPDERKQIYAYLTQLSSITFNTSARIAYQKALIKSVSGKVSRFPSSTDSTSFCNTLK